LNAYEEESLKKIFKFTINYVFTKNKIKYGEMMNKLVDSTIELYEKTANTFKPKPSTVH